MFSYTDKMVQYSFNSHSTNICFGNSYNLGTQLFKWHQKPCDCKVRPIQYVYWLSQRYTFTLIARLDQYNSLNRPKLCDCKVRPIQYVYWLGQRYTLTLIARLDQYNSLYRPKRCDCKVRPIQYVYWLGQRYTLIIPLTSQSKGISKTLEQISTDEMKNKAIFCKAKPVQIFGLSRRKSQRTKPVKWK